MIPLLPSLFIIIMDEIRKYKIVLTGDSNVGKTFLTWRYKNPEGFPRGFHATIGLDYI